jgi:Ca2+-binding RTX toxin-like protein
MPGPVTTATASGTSYIDGLLYGNLWDGTALSYSYPSATSDLGGSWSATYPNSSAFHDMARTDMVQDPHWSTSGKSAISSVFSLYSSVCNLTFTESTGDTDLQIYWYDDDANATAQGCFPNSDPVRGDLLFGNGMYGRWNGSVGVVDYADWSLGSYQYFVVIHEVGHTLGLKHPHDSIGSFPAIADAEDSIEYSVMSYRSYAGGPVDGSYTVAWYPTTLMAYDISALQYLYGANYSTNSGDTTYTFDPTATYILKSVWDGGGTDLYDLSNYTTDLNLDLTPGGWLKFGAQYSQLDTGVFATGNVANAYLCNGNTASLIENATGGSGNDTITGNEANNVLIGNGGADSLDGGTGNDSLEGGLGNDTLLGGDGNDSLLGGSGNDSIDGGAGNDTLYAGYGDWFADSVNGAGAHDTVLGGDGNDALYAGWNYGNLQGGAGNDTLIGDIFDDTLTGGDGNDSLTGGSGNDTLDGGAGNDTLDGGAGNGILDGGTGNDSMTGGSENDSLTGGAGNDTLDGGSGYDTLDGGTGDDSIAGGDGIDVLTGGDGNDTLIGGSGDDAYTGGAGSDVFQGSVSDLTGDTITSLEAGDSIIVTGADLSSLNGSSVGNSVNLGVGSLAVTSFISGSTWQTSYSGGNTTLTVVAPASSSGGGGGGGGSTSQGGSVTTTLPSGVTSSSSSSTGPASDQSAVLQSSISGSSLPEADKTSATAALTGYMSSLPAGTDVTVTTLTLTGSGSPVAISGSDGNEAMVIDVSSLPPGTILTLDNVEFAVIIGAATITGGSGSNYVVGDSSVQYIVLGPENDTLDGGAGNDTIGSAGGQDVLSGGDGQDSVFGGDDNDRVYGNAGNDTVCGNQGDDQVRGGKGYDWVYGGRGNDSVYGDAGVDLISGDLGDDLAAGGDGGDWIWGGAGNDTVYGNQGSDLLAGGDGNDFIYGGNDDDLMWGEDGNDLLSGDRGNDTLSGGRGADIFMFWPGGGTDTIADFDAAAGDRIQLAAGTTWQVGSTATGDAELFLATGDAIILKGITAGSVSTNWVVSV